MRVFGFVLAVGLVAVGLHLVPAEAAEAPTANADFTISASVGAFAE